MKEFDEFVSIMRRLRTECPWDKEQTHESLKKHFIEEAYEAAEAIDKQRFDDLKGELGDVALQVVFHSLIAEEERRFTLEEVLSAISEKLVRRHPHIYGNAVINSGSEQSALWDKIKMSEGRMSVLEGIPMHLPALMRAEKVQVKASRVGFDWKQTEEVWKKVEEEMSELQDAIASKDAEQTQKEFGDLLFSLVNVSRFIHVHPEEALQATIGRFTSRFQFIERELQQQGKEIQHATLEEMDALWDAAKASE